jgi:hypothetical protein
MQDNQQQLKSNLSAEHGVNISWETSRKHKIADCQEPKLTNLFSRKHKIADGVNI